MIDLEIEIAKLNEEKQNLLSHIQELSSKKRHLEIDVNKLIIEKDKIEKEIASNLNEKRKQSIQIESQANSNHSESILRLREAEHRLEELKRLRDELEDKSKILAQKNSSLDSLYAQFEKKKEDEIALLNQSKKEHEARVGSQIRALSILNSNNEVLLKSIEAKTEEYNKKYNDCSELFKKISDEKRELEFKHKIIKEETIELDKKSEALKWLIKKEIDLNHMESLLENKFLELKQKEQNIDLKAREIAVLEKKVNRVIELNKIEKEVR